MSGESSSVERTAVCPRSVLSRDAASSPARYKVMERPLEETDYDYVAALRRGNKRLDQALRGRRIRIFRSYVNCLAQDFTRICKAIRKLMVDSDVDRPDLAGLLMK